MELNDKIIVPEGAQTVYYKGIGNADPQSGLMYTVNENGYTRSLMLCKSCMAVKKLYISSTVNYINKDALRLFIDLEYIEVHADNAVYRSEDGVLYSKDMTTIIKIPEKIGCEVFRLKPTLKTIEPLSIFRCACIKELYVPESITEKLVHPITMLDGLTAIYADVKNKAYSSFDGMLMNKSKTEVLACPLKKSGSVTLPHTVTEIGAFAFHMCKKITHVTLHEEIRSIGCYAFSNMPLITEITLPSTLEAIGRSAFSDMENLKRIVFNSVVKMDDIRSEFASTENIEELELPECGEDMLYTFLFHKKITTITIGKRRFCSRIPFDLHLFIDKTASRPEEIAAPLLSLLRDHRYSAAGDEKLTAIAAAYDLIYDNNETAKKYIRRHAAKVICALCTADSAELLKGVWEMPGLRLSNKDKEKIIESAIKNTQNGGSPEVQIYVMNRINGGSSAFDPLRL